MEYFTLRVESDVLGRREQKSKHSIFHICEMSYLDDFLNIFNSI